ncbi:MAG: hypothetical protein AAF745_04815 [Planctomycetota bacterium]
MAYALLGFLVLLVIVQAVVVWKASADWRWYQVTPVVILMLLAVVFAYPTAGALKSRQAWHKVKEDLEERVERVRAEQLELKYGDPNNPLATDGALPLAKQLAILSVEAGRRWRGLQLGQADFNGTPSITLSSPPPGGVEGLPEDNDADAPALPLIPKDLVVYGFGERPQPGVDIPMPVFYLGEFRVTQSTPNQVTLTPTGPLLPAQIQAISQRQASSWSVYELLPLDRHEAFIAEGSTPDDNNLFGRMDEQLIRRLMGTGLPPEELARYLEDGRRSQPDDPPLTRWVKVQFTKNHSIVVDSPDQRDALSGGFFDGSGRAVDSRLQTGNGGEVTFKRDQELIVKEEAANVLLDEGVARLIDTYYLRPLNDYRFVLRRIRLRIAELRQRQTELNFEQEVLQRAIDATVSMLTSGQTEKLKLEQDLAQFEIERLALAKYNASVKADVNATKTRLVRLYRDNQSLAGQLEQIHQSITTGTGSLTATSLNAASSQ